MNFPYIYYKFTYPELACVAVGFEISYKNTNYVELVQYKYVVSNSHAVSNCCTKSIIYSWQSDCESILDIRNS